MHKTHKIHWKLPEVAIICVSFSLENKPLFEKIAPVGISQVSYMQILLIGWGQKFSEKPRSPVCGFRNGECFGWFG